MNNKGKKGKNTLHNSDHDSIRSQTPVYRRKKADIASEPPTRNQDIPEPQQPSEHVPPVERESSSRQEASGLNSSFLPTMSKQVTELVNNGKQIKEDLKNIANLILTVNSSVISFDTKTTSIDKKIDIVAAKIDDVLKKRDFDYTARDINNRIQNAYQNLGTTFQNLSGKFFQEARSVSEEVKKISKAQQKIKIELSQQLDEMEDKLRGIGESTDLIQSLPGKIDGITEILSVKGLRIKQALPAINHDEETLAQLAEYGEEIFQQLATAARWYARVLPDLSKHEETISNLNAAHQKENENAAKNGEERGRKAIIRTLLRLYDEENLHELMEPAEDVDGRLKVLANFLKNQGVEPIYQMHDEIEITEDNLMKYEHNIANLRPGKIVITSPGYTFDTQTISKAKYMPAEEYYAAQSLDPEEIPSPESFIAMNEEPVSESGEGTNAITTNNEDLT